MGDQVMIEKQNFHAKLVWLEENIRKPLQGSLFDIWVASPVKKIYCEQRKQA